MKAAYLCIVGLILSCLLHTYNARPSFINCSVQCSLGGPTLCDCYRYNSLRLNKRAPPSARVSAIRVPFRYGKRSDSDFLPQYGYGNDIQPRNIRRNNYEEALDLVRNALYGDY